MTRRAYSLLEVILSLALITLVMGLTLAFLFPALRASVRGTLRVEMQQQAVTALNRLCSDVRRTSVAGLSLRSGPPPIAVAACPVSGPDLRSGQPGPMQPDGTVVWSDFFVIYYLDESSRKLMRREWPPGPPAPTVEETTIIKPRRLSPARLAQILSQPAANEMVLATDVASFEIEPGPGGSDSEVAQPVRFRLVLERRGNTGHLSQERFIYTRSVFLRNQK